MIGTCATCRFFAPHSRIDRDIGGPVNLPRGDCRRMSPRARMTRDGGALPAIWPSVGKDAFCGEHRARSA